MNKKKITMKLRDIAYTDINGYAAYNSWPLSLLVFFYEQLVIYKKAWNFLFKKIYISVLYMLTKFQQCSCNNK